MQLSQILNFDTPYEHLKDGDLVHAGNVMIDKDTQTIQNEPGLKDFYIHGVDANIVGHIECNQEFVLFFDNSQIYRVNVTVVILNLLIFVGIGAADKCLELILIMLTMNL